MFLKSSVLASCFMLIVGCVRESASDSDSLHALEHSVPHHWPSDLMDASRKIQERVKLLSDPNRDAAQDRTVWEELVELVEWGPQIAADTDLSETDWLPLYLASEQLAKKLREDPNAMNVELQKSMAEYIESIVSANARIPTVEVMSP